MTTVFANFIFAVCIFWVTSCGQGVCSYNGCGAIAGQSIDTSVVVTITGNGFQPGAKVTVNGTSCTGVTVLSSTKLTCTLPSSSIQIINTVVTNPDGSAPTVNPGASVTKTITSIVPATFAVPSGVTSLQIELWGAGGGGAGSDGQSGAGGGGGGGYLKKNSYPVTPGQNVSYSVGAGGAGNSFAANGSSGGDTAITTPPTLTAYGGHFGYTNSFLGPNGKYGEGGPGGTALGGDIIATGTAGGTTFGLDTGGKGGNGANGGAGGLGGTNDTNGGTSGTSPGGGGGGGSQYNSGGDGAAGANGKVVFTYSVP